MREDSGYIDWCIGDLYGSWCGGCITFGIPHCESEFEHLPIHENSIQIDVGLAMRGIDAAWKILHPNHITAIVCKIHSSLLWGVDWKYSKMNMRKFGGKGFSVWRNYIIIFFCLGFICINFLSNEDLDGSIPSKIPRNPDGHSLGKEVIFGGHSSWKMYWEHHFHSPVASNWRG